MAQGIHQRESTSEPLRILWLCSWFPNRRDPYDGDFVLRHAEAASMYHRIDVIHVPQNVLLLDDEVSSYKQQYNAQLHAEIHYPVFHHALPAFVGKFLFNLQYRKRLLNALKEYIREHGLPDLVHVHVPVKAGWGARWLKRKYGIPFVVTEHSSAYFRGIENGYFTRGWLFRQNTRRTFEEAAIVTSVSEWLLKRLRELFSLPNTALIRNVASAEHFFPVIKHTGKKRFIHVSMMNPLKNVHGILEALAIVKQERSDWELVMVGPACDATKQKAKSLGLEDFVHWKGLLPHDNVAAEMRNAHTLLHFSEYENLPCVVQEALCCGLYIISSDVGGIAELVNHENGTLVKRADIKALANAICNYLSVENTIDQFAVSREAMTAFSPQKIGAEFSAMYTALLERKN